MVKCDSPATNRQDVPVHSDRSDQRPAAHRRNAGQRTPDPGPEYVEHGHGHGHSPAPPASGRVRRLLGVLLVPCALAAVVGALLLYPWGKHPTANSDLAHQVPVKGDVIAVVTGGCTAGASSHLGTPAGSSADSANADAQARQCLLVTVQMTGGVAAGQSVTEPVPIEPSTPRFSVGDHVVLAYNGTNPGNPESYEIVDFQRGVPLVALALLFALAVLVLGRWQGLAALGALVLSFLVLVFFVLPAILAGHDPVLVAVVGAGLIMFVVLYLTHGLSARTSTAVLGTLVSLALIGGLGMVFSAVARLTGLDEDTANLIAVLGHGVDSRGLLLAGVVIGALGVLDDVTVTQTSAVWELRRANPALGWRQLYAAGLRIGRDHVSSAVNTLVMAYAGAALPVLLAYSLSGRGFGDVVSAQAVAQEVMRTLVGSIGLVASVPITTVLAALVASQERIVTDADEDPDEDFEEESFEDESSGADSYREPEGPEPLAATAGHGPATSPPTERGAGPDAREPSPPGRRSSAPAWIRRDSGAPPRTSAPADRAPGYPGRPDGRVRPPAETGPWRTDTAPHGFPAERVAPPPTGRQPSPAHGDGWAGRPARGGSRPGGTIHGRLSSDEFAAHRWPPEPSDDSAGPRGAGPRWPPEPPDDRPEPGPPRRHRYREP
jgi:uncharacterized membrane protein